VDPVGSRSQIEAVERLVDDLRLAHPILQALPPLGAR
jgi:hypothetical protein